MPRPDAVSRRILIADDHRDSAESLGILLRRLGHDVRISFDGLEAVAAAEEFRPAIVLLDIGMPRLDGYDAARRIREQQATPRPVLVALTGWGSAEDRRRAEAAGFDAHLVKPVELASLTRLIQDLPPG